MLYKQMILCFCLFIVSLISPAQNFTVSFQHYVGNEKLIFGNIYQNGLQQPFTVSKFKYYISNICLFVADKKIIPFSASYLINEEEESSKRIILPLSGKQKFTAIEFIIGVDSLHNCSGIQSGDLDPVKGMFWTWNSGYVFLKLEGKSNVSPLPANLIEYHIGGYKVPANAIRKIRLNFKETDTLQLKVDILQLISFRNKIDFVTMPSITGNTNTVLMAENFSGMFSVAQ